MGFLAPRIEEAKRVLATNGSLFLHVDSRESHYCKILLDQIFGRDSFMNEIIWSYDYGGRSKRKWPTKHDTIFWYAKDPGNYTFNYDDIDRIPYMAPGLVGKEKAARGKTPTDVWWQTIVPTNGKERTGYPTQKPLAILERIVKVHSNPGELVLDFFAGSGTTGVAAAKNDRQFVLIDTNPEAVQVAAKRLTEYTPKCIGFTPEPQAV
jgi:site-specific DNA-methyltransferase (adenine-specific)